MWADLKIQVITVSPQGSVISANVVFYIVLNAQDSHQHLYLLQNTMNMKHIQEQAINLMELIYNRAHISINITEPRKMQLAERDVRSSVPIHNVPTQGSLLNIHTFAMP